MSTKENVCLLEMVELKRSFCCAKCNIFNADAMYVAISSDFSICFKLFFSYLCQINVKTKLFANCTKANELTNFILSIRDEREIDLCQ